MKQEKRSKWKIVLIVVLMLFVFSFLISLFFRLLNEVPEFGNVAHIKIYGPIMVTKSGGWMSSGTSSTDIAELIEKADKAIGVKAILLEINSPGGSAVASDEIARAIKKSNKTTVAWIREVGASGAYWIASATDHIVANRMSVTGSIGVIGSYLEFAELIEQYNVTYRRMVAGKYKDLGSPFKELTEEEESLLQDLLDQLHEEFIQEVASNRNLPYEKTKEIATGMFYLGKQAKELGLVDALGGKEEAIAYLEKQMNATATLAKYEKPKGFWELLTEVFAEHSFRLGEGLGESLFRKKGLLET
ncbi:signal peptide peptidase SppA [Candidatus Woesearchaeota archaeon]|nr:signal peptide peptidase SppA [Candidatus Woesearchaeota archaeon]